VLPRRALERAFDEAEYLRLDCSGLRPIRGRRGYGRLTHVLRRHAPGSTRTRSTLEDRFLELCAAHELPRPEVNVSVENHEVDFHWRDARLVVEIDGDAAHRTKRAFEADRVRDAELAVSGHRVVRITEERLDTAPAEVARQLRLLRRTRR
jgi:very-short-patch-repair endonuclease